MRGCSAMPGSQERPCIPFRKYRNKFCFQRNRNPMRKSAKPAGKKTTSSSNDRALREHLVYLLKGGGARSEEHTSELQSLAYLVCRLLLEKKKRNHPRSDYECERLRHGRRHTTHLL